MGKVIAILATVAVCLIGARLTLTADEASVYLRMIGL